MRDKAALKNKGIATADLVPGQLTEKKELAELAKQHGYDNGLIPDEATEQRAKLNRVAIPPTYPWLDPDQKSRGYLS